MNQDVMFEIEQSKLDIPTIKINNYYIHSKYNPLKEAEQFAMNNYQEGNFHILFGNGLGYYTEAFRKVSINKEDFAIYEPAENLPYTGDIEIQQDFELLKRVISEKTKLYENIHVIAIPNYIKLFPEKYKEVLSYTKDQMIMTKVFENTVNRYSKEWQENYIKNLKYVENDFDIQELRGKYNVPVIVASAGPSLGKHVPLLKKMREKYILVAAGSSITALMKYELEPDFIVTMDGGIANAQHFKDLKISKAKLVYSLVTHYKIREGFTGQACHYLSTDCYEMEHHYNKLTNNAPLKLAGGGSVATYALSFARYLSTGPITLVGQDLAYTNNTSHDVNNRSSQKLTEVYIKQHGIFETIGYNNEKVFTDHGFLAMREVFESLITELDSSDQIFNSTEAGLTIKGIEDVPLIQFSQQYLENNENVNLDVTFKRNFVENGIILQGLRKELSEYDKGIHLLNESLKVLKSTQALRKFKQSVLVKLDSNEKEILRISEHLPIVIAVKKVVIKIIKSTKVNEAETEYMKYKRIYQKNELLYTELLAIFKETKIHISKLLDGEEEKNKL